MKIKRNHVINIVFIILVIGAIIYLQDSTNKFEETLLHEGKFAIGTFDSFGYGYKAGGRNYKYSYYEDGKITHVTGQKNMPNSKHRLIIRNGDQFLVLYDKDGNSIFFDKRILDSTDFKRYVKEFEEMRNKDH